MARRTGVARAIRIARTLVAVAALQACAVNPLVQLDEIPKTPKLEPHALDQGRDFSAAARQKYMAKMYSQVSTAVEVQSGLITLGGVVALLAAGKVHRDVILGATMGGATVFALGQWNLDKRRLLIYNGAIAGFNCADRAVTPLDASRAQLESLDKANRSLAVAIAAATGAAAETEFEIDQWLAVNPAAAQFAAPFSKAVSAAQQAVAAASTTQAAGENLHYQSSHASVRLIDAVRRIDQEANAAQLDTLNDLNKVPTVIASLAGIAGSIAPGSDVESAFTEALKNSVVVPKVAPAGGNPALTSTATPPASLLKAATRMTTAVRHLHTEASIVLGKVRPFGLPANANALADCGIGTLNFAMATVPGKLSVPVAVPATYTVRITGGKAPYSVKVNGAAIPGVAVPGVDRFDPFFHVVVAAEATKPQVANYLIADSSDPNRLLSFTIETVGTDKAAADKAAADKAAADKAAAVRAQAAAAARALAAASAAAAGASAPAPPSPALAAMRSVKPFEWSASKVFPSPAQPGADGTFIVRVSCNPAPQPPACLAQSDLRRIYVALAGEPAKGQEAKVKFENLAPGTCACN